MTSEIMKEYSFSSFDVLNLDGYNTPWTKVPAYGTDTDEQHLASLYSSLQNTLGDELLTQTNCVMDRGMEFMNYSKWPNDIPGENFEEMTNVVLQQGAASSDVGPIKDLEEHLPEPSCKLLQRLQDKKVNLVLVATSLDEGDVIKKLENTLDPQNSKMIPLSFKDDERDHSDTPEESGSISGSDDSGIGLTENGEDSKQKLNQNSLKRKRVNKKDADEKYWKRRNSNNQAAKRSREAKRARFVWIENRTKELEVENARLEEQLQSLKSKLSELESRA